MDAQVGTTTIASADTLTNGYVLMDDDIDYVVSTSKWFQLYGETQTTLDITYTTGSAETNVYVEFYIEFGSGAPKLITWARETVEFLDESADQIILEEWTYKILGAAGGTAYTKRIQLPVCTKGIRIYAKEVNVSTNYGNLTIKANTQAAGACIYNRSLQTVVLETLDIQIGAVEIKHFASDDRVSIITDNDTATATPNVLMTGAIYKAALDTYVDNDAAPIPVTANGVPIVTITSGAALTPIFDTIGHSGYVRLSNGTIEPIITAAFAETLATATDYLTVGGLCYGLDANNATPILTAIQVAVDNTTVSTTPNVLLTGAVYKAALDTYTDNDCTPIPTTSKGVPIIAITSGDSLTPIFDTNAHAGFVHITDGTTDVAVASGTAALQVDISGEGGSALSATNPVWTQLTNGSNAIAASYPLNVQIGDGTNQPTVTAAFTETLALATDYFTTGGLCYGMDSDNSGAPILAAMQVAIDNATISATPNVLVTGGIYKAALDTYNDNDAVPFHFGAGGLLLTDVNGLGGSVAHSGADAGNPIKIGARAEDGQIAAVTAADRTDLITNLFGELVNAGFTWATNSNRAEEIDPLSEHYTNESLVDTTNISAATHYYPSSTGGTMDGYQDLSLTGKFIDADETLTLTFEVTNDEDASGDWNATYFWDDELGVAATSKTVTNGTELFSLSLNNNNFRRYRWAVEAGGNTNTVVLKQRMKAL